MVQISTSSKMEKQNVLKMICEDFEKSHIIAENTKKNINDLGQETIIYIKELLEQVASANPGPLIAKTPKIKKRTIKIKPIREDSILETSELSLIDSVKDTPQKEDTQNAGRSKRGAATRNADKSTNKTKSNENGTMESTETSLNDTSRNKTFKLDTNAVENTENTGRSKRGASIRATDNIKKQQSINLTSKLRRPSNDDLSSDSRHLSKKLQENKSKRPKGLSESSEEELRPSKQMKLDKKKANNNRTKNCVIEDTLDSTSDTILSEDISIKAKPKSLKRKLEEQDKLGNFSDQTYVKQNNGESSAKKPNTSKLSRLERISEISAKRSIDDTINTNIADNTVEPSLYEDALCKPMNSTMMPDSTATLDKIMNATVVIEPIKPVKNQKPVLNETVTILRSFKQSFMQNNTKLLDNQDEADKTIVLETNDKVSNITYKAQIDTKLMSSVKVVLENNNLNDLITDDESSPERKTAREKKRKLITNQTKRTTRSNSSVIDDGHAFTTPNNYNHDKDFKIPSAKSAYKQTALFSPYAKDSVKKRVKAFEQVALSPKNDELNGRVTRTKTRALAAVNYSEIPTPTVSQKLARKSLSKAKKIALAKDIRDEEAKENENSNFLRPPKHKSSLEKSAQKPQYQKTTPLGKNRILQIPSSVNRNQQTPSNSNIISAYSKHLTSASRGNIVNGVDSFIQPMKSASKRNSHEKSNEEKRRRHDEDARQKREELLRAQADEKRRKREEKEMKNKLAREAKEKQEKEKRLKAEKEKEEKAKHALIAQEKMKEEIEKKKIAQQQRAQEKEERRRQEEQLRLQRLHEQEEAEKHLAEQRRREQEAEKRKQAEAKSRNMIQSAKPKPNVLQHQKQVPSSYKIDSDPDEDESDDESKPKHQIPPWATKQVRQKQLTMQRHIPMIAVLKFFDAKKCTPDLTDLFKGIDPRKLKRSSSALWKTPPRYSMMNQSIIKD